MTECNGKALSISACLCLIYCCQLHASTFNKEHDDNDDDDSGNGGGGGG